MPRGIPFAALTNYDVPTLYALKGEIVRRGVKDVTGLDMPVFPKRRFQHGAVPVEHPARLAWRRRSRLSPGVPRALLVNTTYPQRHADRDRFVLGVTAAPSAQRTIPWRHHGVLVEESATRSGAIVRAATVFLTGRECPWRCVMCDLWRFTLEGDTPPGAIPHQIGLAIDELRAAGTPLPTHIKLYNAGSFFDPRAVPPADYDAIAAQVGGFDHVIVESHPALVGSRVDDLLASLDAHPGPRGVPTLEVAMGLETTNPSALDRLHKRMTVADFAKAADELRERGVPLRVFLLVFPPFVPAHEQDVWLSRSVETAFACGASAVSLIPLRLGNGSARGPAAAGRRRTAER